MMGLTEEQVLAALTLDDLLNHGTAAHAEFKRAEDRKKLISRVLLAKLAAIGFTKGMSYVREADNVSVGIQTKAGVDKIDPAKLIAKGVAMDIITFATEKGKDSEPFIVIRVPKTKSEQGDDDKVEKL